MELILKYFPELKKSQLEAFEEMKSLYAFWNEKVNVVSRKDIEFLIERHILHSLALAKFKRFGRESKVLDVGTGGGFPGIPLAVFYPKCKFHLVDSIGKKIMVVNEIAKALQLSNVRAEQTRVENLQGKYDYIVSRAVAPTQELLRWTKHLAEKERTQYMFLKGGDLTEELKPIGFRASVEPISKHYSEEFFETKKIVYIKF
jgi:16S rRNA (guanine527-N7)-methyltransferase